MAKRTSTKSKAKEKPKAIAKKEPVNPRTRTIEFDDEEYQIATISAGRNITDPEKIEIAQLVCLMYSTDQYSLDECLMTCGIKSDSTWWKWLDEIKEIEPLYSEAQRKKDHKYRHRTVQRARTMVERLIDGYTIDIEEREAEPVNLIDNEGKKTTAMQTTKIKKKQVIVRPSVSLIQSVLFNSDAKVFERNPKPIEKMNKDVNIPPIDWVE